MKKCSRYIVLAVGIAIVIMLGIVGLKCNENFWEVGIQNCATWLIAILVSFFLVQEKMDERVRKQLLISLLKIWLTIRHYGCFPTCQPKQYCQICGRLEI